MADKYYRLVTFVIDICPEPVRELFIKNAKADPKPGTPYTTLSDYLAFRKQDIVNLKRNRILRDDQYDLLYPKTGVVDEMQWDITLLVLLSNNLFNLTAVEKRNMVDIRKVRNDLQHISGTTTLTDKQFNDYWTKLELATLALARAVSGSQYADTIKSKITDTKINNMPQLGNILTKWYEDIIMQQKHDIEEIKKNTKDSSEILRGVCATKPASSRHKGHKRLRTLDHILTKLQAIFEMTMNSSHLEHFDAPSAEVSDIKTKLRNNHLVIVAGHSNIQYLQIALVAIRSMKYDNRRCMEITNSIDWSHIDPEDVELVLCLDPFGKGSYDENKSSCMSDVFTNMQYTVKREEGRNALDIVIVTDVAVLNECRKHHYHEILEEVVTVFPPTTEQQPCDLTKACGTSNNRSSTQTVTQNTKDFTTLFLKHYKNNSKQVVDSKVKEARGQLKAHKMLVIEGPRKCGKTALAVALAADYQMSDCLLLKKPENVEHIDLNQTCLVIIDDFAGKYRFDEQRACQWYEAFDTLYAAVTAGKLNLIITCEKMKLERCLRENDPHPLLVHTVDLSGHPLRVSIKMEVESGLGQVESGAETMALGAGQVASGAGEVVSGAGEVASGAGQVALGAGEVVSGEREVGLDEEESAKRYTTYLEEHAFISIRNTITSIDRLRDYLTVMPGIIECMEKDSTYKNLKHLSRLKEVIRDIMARVEEYCTTPTYKNRQKQVISERDSTTSTDKYITAFNRLQEMISQRDSTTSTDKYITAFNRLQEMISQKDSTTLTDKCITVLNRLQEMISDIIECMGKDCKTHLIRLREVISDIIECMENDSNDKNFTHRIRLREVILEAWKEP